MQKKAVVILICCVTLMLSYPSLVKGYEGQVSAQQAVAIDATTGRVLFDKDMDRPRPIASITKVMTALLAIEYGNLEEKVNVSKAATEVEGSSIYLEENEKMTLEDLLYGLMLRSGNDAAIAIAEHIGGSEEGFVHLMNEKAQYIGMTNTNFANPHGLDEEGHYSSAYDIALLMKHAMENELFQKISGTTSYLSKNREYKWFNKNKLLTKLYPHCTGGKTGFTRKAGRTLVTTAERDGISLIVVTLNAGDDWNDHISLYEYFFSHLEPKVLEKKGNRSVSFQGWEDREVWVDETIILPLSKEEETRLQKQILVKRAPSTKKVGYLQIELDDEPVMTVPLYEKKPFYFILFDELSQAFNYMIGYERDG